MQTFVAIKALLRKICPLLPEINREGKQTFGVLNRLVRNINLEKENGKMLN
jgi:hypothetical protein